MRCPLLYAVAKPKPRKYLARWGAALHIIPGGTGGGWGYEGAFLTCSVATGSKRDAISASGTLNWPWRKAGGETASTASSFSGRIQLQVNLGGAHIGGAEP